MEEVLYVENGITGDYEITIAPVLYIPDNYYRINNFIRVCPYYIRLIYWILLYYFNKRKWPNESFTLDLYKSYAK